MIIIANVILSEQNPALHIQQLVKYLQPVQITNIFNRSFSWSADGGSRRRMKDTRNYAKKRKLKLTDPQNI